PGLCARADGGRRGSLTRHSPLKATGPIILVDCAQKIPVLPAWIHRGKSSLQCRGSEKTPMETVHPPGRAELLRELEGQTDTQLLGPFGPRRDSVALEALVRRHATMVWGVCRRDLANHHDAEDARAPLFTRVRGSSWPAVETWDSSRNSGRSSAVGI